jgi:DNA-directed RNA polymerase specialized sigma24 family protein
MSNVDMKLLSSARKGDIEAYEKLTGVWHKRVYNIILKSCGAGHDASELTQEVFVKVFAALRRTSEKVDEIMLPVMIARTAGEVCKRVKL